MEKVLSPSPPKVLLPSVPHPRVPPRRTDRVNFKRGYTNRRINLTFLYGHPGDRTCRMRGGGSPARRKVGHSQRTACRWLLNSKTRNPKSEALSPEP